MSEYRDGTAFAATTTHSVKEIAQAIRTKKYGKDVREALAQSIEKAAALSSEAGNLKFYFANGKKPKMDFETGIITFPNGAVHGLNLSYAVTFDEQSLETTENISWLGFDLANKKFISSNNSSAEVAIVGFYHKRAGVFEIFNSESPMHTIVASQLHGSARTIKFFFGEWRFAKFDLVNKKLIIPSGSYQSDDDNGNERFDAQTIDLVDGIDWIVFDVETKSFSIGAPTSTKVVVGAYDTNNPISCQLYNGLYSIDGIFPAISPSVGIVYTSGEIRVDPLNKKLILNGNFQTNLGNKSYFWTQNEALDISGSNFLLFDITAKKILYGEPEDPKNAYVQIGYSFSGGKYVYIPTANIRYGSSILIVGNSIMAGVGTSLSVTKQIEYGLSRLGIAVDITNNSVPSTAVSNGKWLSDQDYIDRIQTQTGNFGSVLIHLGENEFNGSREIGDVTSTDTNTMCGGLNALITMLRANNTKGQIFVSTPSYAYYEGHDWKTKVNAIGKKLDDYIEAFAEVARLRGCIWIDNRNLSFVPHEVSNQTVDGLHPNAVGARMLAGNIVSKISGFIATDFGIDDDIKHHGDSVIS